MLEQEERREDEVQDPPEMKAPRTFGRGGLRRKTGAELAMKELERGDKLTLHSRHQKQPSMSRQRNSLQSSAPAKNIASGLISGAHLPAAELARFVMERDPPLAAQQRPLFNSTQIRDTDQEIEIIQVWSEEELQAEANSILHRSNPCRRKLKRSVAEISPQTSPSRPKRNVGLPYRYRQGKGMLVQPRKCRKQC